MRDWKQCMDMAHLPPMLATPTTTRCKQIQSRAANCFRGIGKPQLSEQKANQEQKKSDQKNESNLDVPEVCFQRLGNGVF